MTLSHAPAWDAQLRNLAARAREAALMNGDSDDNLAVTGLITTRPRAFAKWEEQHAERKALEMRRRRHLVRWLDAAVAA